MITPYAMSNASDDMPSPKCLPKLSTGCGGVCSGRPLPQIPTERRSVMEILGVTSEYLMIRPDEEPSGASKLYVNTTV